MKLLSHVRTLGVRPETVIAMVVADSIWKKYGAEAVITSLIDSEHSRNSLHYSGQAFDLRSRNLTKPSPLMNAVAELKEALGKDFDVVLERDHVHVEFQPHRGYQ